MADDAEQSKHTGGMVALLPADPAPLTLPDGEPADDIHCTLHYLGEDVTGWDDHRLAGVVAAAQAAAGDVDGPIEARVGGHATFNPGPDPVAVHLITGSPTLAQLRAGLDRRLGDLLGGDLHPQHEPWTAHVTGRYGATAADLSYTGPVVFDRLLVSLAGQRTVIPLVDHTTQAAWEAFACGWADSGGPWTARVAAAARVATRWVHEHGPTPAVLEAVAATAQFEGVLAQVLARRHDLIVRHVADVMTAWRALTGQVSAADLVRRYRTEMGLTEAVVDPAGDQDRRRAAARAEAERSLHGVVYPSSVEYQAAVSALADALLDAQAEGHAAGAALVAVTRAEPAVDFDVEFRDAHAALERLDSWAPDATSWFGQILDGQAADVGSALARVARDGGDFTDMVDAVSAVLDGPDIKAVDTIVDLAMSQSFSRGSAALYGREGITQADYSTAGGDRVCPICLDAESGNPWPLDQCPKPALHPNCRCTILPVIDVNALFGAMP